MAFRLSLTRTIQTIAFFLTSICSTVFANPVVYQVDKNQESIKIDGKLDEEAWQNAKKTDQFSRYIPDQGGSPPGSTSIQLLQDDEHLYIGVVVSGIDYDLQARISPREKINDDDQIGVYIDPQGDGRGGYIFYFNPFGIQQDTLYANGNWYGQWNAIIYTEGQITDDGFVLEIAIPFRSIRYTTDAQWKMIFTRKIPSQGTKYSYPQIQRNHPRLLTQGAPIENLHPPPASAGVQIQPTISASTFSSRDEEGIFSRQDWNKDTVRPSLDVRWGISSERKLAMTIYPDFSQVEADVRQLNLNQRFAFFYPERRPFFLDNLDLFSDQGSTLYTRSIVNPLYGIKYSSQQDNWSVGILQSIDQSPSSSVHEFGTPGFSEEELENMWAENFYIRARKNAFSAGYIGFFASDKRVFDPNFSQSSSGFNDIFGTDIQIPIGNDITINTQGSGSFAGTHEDSLLGGFGSFGISKKVPRGLDASMSISGFSEDYRREMGFLTTSGRYSGNLNFQHTSFSTKDHIRKLSLSSSHTQEKVGNSFSQAKLTASYRIPSVITISSYIGPNFITFEQTDITGFISQIRSDVRVNKKLKFSISGNYNQEIDYQSFEPIRVTTINASSTIRPTQGIWLDITIFDQFLQNQGEDQNEIQRARSYYNRLNWQFTEIIGLRWIQQTTISPENTKLNSNLLLTWLKNPGNEAYIGGSWQFSDENSDTFEIQDQQIFLKYTHVFQY